MRASAGFALNRRAASVAAAAFAALDFNSAICVTPASFIMKATSCPLLVKTPLGGKCCALLKTFFGFFADQAGPGKVSAVVERGLDSFSVNVWEVGDRTQGFRRMAAKTSLPESEL